MLQQLQNYVKEGCPARLKQTPVQIQPYWNYQDEITVMDGTIYKGQKVVIPKQLRAELLRKIHIYHKSMTTSPKLGYFNTKHRRLPIHSPTVLLNEL